MGSLRASSCRVPAHHRAIGVGVALSPPAPLQEGSIQQAGSLHLHACPGSQVSPHLPAEGPRLQELGQQVGLGDQISSLNLGSTVGNCTQASFKALTTKVLGRGSLVCSLLSLPAPISRPRLGLYSNWNFLLLLLRGFSKGS